MITPHDAFERARDATGLGARPAHDGSPARGSRSPRVPFALLVTGLIVGSLALLLALNTASAANELRRHELVQQDDAVAATVQDLRVRVANSAAPANLARAAAELGMVPAGNPAFIVIGADGKARILGKPKRASAPVVPQPAPTKPTPTATPSATPTSSPSARSTARPSATPTGRAGTPTRPGGTPTASRPAPRPSTPTATPTPTITLPGGTR